MTVVHAQVLVGGLDSGGAAEEELSSVVGSLSGEVLSSTLFYEYEGEYDYISEVQSATLGDIVLKMTPDGKLLVKIPAEDIALGAVLTVSAPDGKLLARQTLSEVETTIALQSKVVIAKVEVNGKASKVVKITQNNS